MASSDPLDEAARMHRGGHTHAALTLLRDAIRANPGRADLKSSLLEMQRTLVEPAPLNWRALLVPMAITVCAGAAAFLSVPLLVARLETLPVWEWSGAALAGCWLTLGLLFVAAIFATIRGCLHAWFWYLCRLDDSTRAEVELALPRYYAVYALEPGYSQVRRKYLG